MSYPAVALPVASLVSEANTLRELFGELYVPKHDIEPHIDKHYSPKTSVGMPVGVQILAPRLHKNLVKQAARIIQEALRG